MQGLYSKLQSGGKKKGHSYNNFKVILIWFVPVINKAIPRVFFKQS